MQYIVSKHDRGSDGPTDDSI